MKNFKGNAIYNPSGKAGEYSYWACNFFVGCSGRCTYCYLKKGILAKTMGGDKPALKKCFKDESHAYSVFTTEVYKNLKQLQEHGLFLSFTTDPLLPETILLTRKVIMFCASCGIPVKLLTKQTAWLDDLEFGFAFKSLVSIGFTLTGHDELEHGCATNQERIEAMEKIHDGGFKTFASIEPVIDFHSSYEMIRQTLNFCDHYKIGLESGKVYKKDDTDRFRAKINELIQFTNHQITVYWKDSIFKYSSHKREFYNLPSFCVDASYNQFQ